MRLLGKIEHIFATVSTMFEPTDDGSRDNVVVTSSYDPSSHFESASKVRPVAFRSVTARVRRRQHVES